MNKSQFPVPEYATPASAGVDLRANISEPITLGSLERILVPTGLFLAIPEGYFNTKNMSIQKRATRKTAR